MKKKLIIFIYLIISTLTVFTQERVNKPMPQIGTQIKGLLTKSTGWLLNPEGQWVSRQNRIPAFIENEFKILMDYEYNGLGSDNFISYQLREVKIQDSTYSILIKKYKDGYYKYPSIKKGWTSHNSVVYYVFASSELSKLKKIVNDSINMIMLKFIYYNSFTLMNSDAYILDIQKEIAKQVEEKKSNEESENYLVFQIAPYKTKKIVQFQIYSTHSRYNIIGGIINEHKVQEEKDGFSWDKKQIYLSEDLFKHCYYEIDLLTFNSFLKIAN